MKMKYLDASTFSKPEAYGKYVDYLYLPAQQAKLELLPWCLNFDPRADAIMVGTVEYTEWKWLHFHMYRRRKT